MAFQSHFLKDFSSKSSCLDCYFIFSWGGVGRELVTKAFFHFHSHIWILSLGYKRCKKKASLSFMVSNRADCGLPMVSGDITDEEHPHGLLLSMTPLVSSPSKEALCSRPACVLKMVPIQSKLESVLPSFLPILWVHLLKALPIGPALCCFVRNNVGSADFSSAACVSGYSELLWSKWCWRLQSP